MPPNARGKTYIRRFEGISLVDTKKGAVMDEQRFQTLVRKRDEAGLSDEEANELGRMFAEREGKPYRNASDIHPDDPEPNGVSPAAEEEAVEREEAGQDATPEPPDEEREEDREAELEKRGGQRYS
jgi:hypothetical protein